LLRRTGWYARPIRACKNKSDATFSSAPACRKALAILERIPTLPLYDQFNVAAAHVGLAGLAAVPGSGLSAAEGQVEADRAMTWLRTAVDGGYRPAISALSSPEFNPLRSRADFQDMTFPKDPFTPAH
jgi:hypothetical protein